MKKIRIYVGIEDTREIRYISSEEFYKMPRSCRDELLENLTSEMIKEIIKKKKERGGN